jgi:hypothetical protein
MKKGDVEAVHILSKFLGTDLAFIDSQPRFTNTGILMLKHRFPFLPTKM